MSAQPKPNEPSMEEILASIRRIIADDEVKPAEEAAVAAPSVPVEEKPAGQPELVDEDVLDLGAEASLVTVSTPSELKAEPTAFEDIEFLDTPAPEPAFVPEPAAEPAQPAAPPPVQMLPQPEAAPQPFDMAQLLSDQASSSVTSAFGQLAHTVLSNNARTLEDLVKDMLKPMLKSWLDDNLPTMVERLVRAEIERVARGGRS